MSPAETDGENGLVVLGRDVKALVDNLERLRRIGLQSVAHKLPELVLVGDQSAGKSSLMSAIAAISLPRGQSMCTKCPTNIKTHHSMKPWSCTVSLQIEYTWIEETDVTHTFPNWEPRREGLNNKAFTTISDPTKLEDVLKWAQIALLNPSRDHTSFIPGTTAQAREALQRDEDPVPDEAIYSPNVIAIEISGDGLPALSFYDLPGLFNIADNKKQSYLVRVFDRLTEKYIQHKNALIICAIPMHNDPSTSKAKALIYEHEAEDRCIGVLTMPDRLQGEDKHVDYDNILRGKAFVLSHGYFVTKQPGPSSKYLAGRSDYHARARQEEETFFKTAKFWKDGDDWAKYRHRCGTGTIQHYLSDQFAKLILKSLPDLEHNITAEAKDVDNELAEIPEVEKNQGQHIVRQRLTKFSAEARAIFDNSSMFPSEWKQLCYQFQKALEIMRPGCHCGHPSDKKRIEVITLDDDSEAPAPVRTEVPQIKGKNKRAAENIGAHERGTKGRHLANGMRAPVKIEDSPKPALRAASLNPRDAKAEQKQFERMKHDGYGPFHQMYLISGFQALSLRDIEVEIQSQATPGFPEFIPPIIREDPALTSIIPWKGPLQTFLNHTFEMLRTKILSVLSDVLEHHKDTELYKRSFSAVTEFLRNHEKLLNDQSTQLYEVESSALFTINEQDFNRNKAEALETLRASRRRHRVAAYVRNQPRTAKAEKNIEDMMNKVTDQQLGHDRFERELEVAAFIRGYYTTARLRFVDLICANMNMTLFQVIKKGLTRLLEQKLKTDSGDCESICQELLSGNGLVAQRRSELRRRKNQLVEFKKVLGRLREARSPQVEDIYSAGGSDPMALDDFDEPRRGSNEEKSFIEIEVERGEDTEGESDEENGVGVEGKAEDDEDGGEEDRGV